MSLEFIDGANLWEKHDGLLLPYAQKNQTSRGREQLHHPDPWRLPFQRDVGRIVNTASFRRLDGKMQVVSPEKGDHFRNRLTHTLEVVRISRDIARRLGLNEDLSEAIALAHDLGHPPFGHSGEEALRKIMQRVGKDFEHNEHSERIVKFIEELNLSRRCCG